MPVTQGVRWCTSEGEHGTHGHGQIGLTEKQCSRISDLWFHKGVETIHQGSLQSQEDSEGERAGSFQVETRTSADQEVDATAAPNQYTYLTVNQKYYHQIAQQHHHNQ